MLGSLSRKRSLNGYSGSKPAGGKKHKPFDVLFAGGGGLTSTRHGSGGRHFQETSGLLQKHCHRV